MRSAQDLTAAAAIRDAAMTLFAARGTAGATVRDVAAAAGVSPSLVIHHYKSKAGLDAAVRDHAVSALSVLAEEFATPPRARDMPAMAQRITERLAADPVLLRYLRRLLVDGGPVAEAVFRSLYELVVASVAAAEAAGVIRPSDDAATRAAFLLVNDLGVMILREQVAAVLGADPLDPDGITRWTAQLADVYTRGIFVPGEGAA